MVATVFCSYVPKNIWRAISLPAQLSDRSNSKTTPWNRFLIGRAGSGIRRVSSFRMKRHGSSANRLEALFNVANGMVFTFNLHPESSSVGEAEAGSGGDQPAEDQPAGDSSRRWQV